MKVVLVAGGTIDPDFCVKFLEKWKSDRIIGIDRGAAFLYDQQIRPDLLVGDFDSLPKEILDYYQEKVPVRTYQCEKDETDMELGMRAALELGANHIAVLGATGTRLDHVVANIQTLMVPLKSGVEAFLIDPHNRIRLIDREKEIDQEHMFGTYISFLPLTTAVEGLTLRGFKYPLEDAVMTSDNSLGVSNEMVGCRAKVCVRDGVLIMIESRD